MCTCAWISHTHTHTYPQAHTLTTTHPQAHMQHVHDNDLARAHQTYAKALALSPDYVPALNSLAALHLAQGDEASVRRVVERAMLLAPDDADTVLNGAALLWDRKLQVCTHAHTRMHTYTRKRAHTHMHMHTHMHTHAHICTCTHTHEHTHAHTHTHICAYTRTCLTWR